MKVEAMSEKVEKEFKDITEKRAIIVKDRETL
jgi:hypothetical protein